MAALVLTGIGYPQTPEVSAAKAALTCGYHFRWVTSFRCQAVSHGPQTALQRPVWMDRAHELAALAIDILRPWQMAKKSSPSECSLTPT